MIRRRRRRNDQGVGADGGRHPLHHRRRTTRWALDARDGRELWHYFWRTRGGTHIGNRGFGMWHDYLYMETPDNYLVSLEAEDRKGAVAQGRRRLQPAVLLDDGADRRRQPRDRRHRQRPGHRPGFLQSFDPETGELQWKLYTVPMNPGDPGLDTWPSLDAARHGGAQPWLPGAYDPETRLYIFGTGNPTPAYTAGRGEGDNLFTCSLDRGQRRTGKMAWYYQTVSARHARLGLGADAGPGRRAW